MRGRQAIAIATIDGASRLLGLGDFEASRVAWKSPMRLIAGLFTSTDDLFWNGPAKRYQIRRMPGVDVDGSHIVNPGEPKDGFRNSDAREELRINPRIQDQLAAFLDAYGAAPDIRDGRLIGYAAANGTRKYLDPDWQHDLDSVSRGPAQAGADRGSTAEGSRVLVRLTEPHLPTAWWLLDRKVKPTQLSPIVETYPEIAKAGLRYFPQCFCSKSADLKTTEFGCPLVRAHALKAPRTTWIFVKTSTLFHVEVVS